MLRNAQVTRGRRRAPTTRPVPAGRPCSTSTLDPVIEEAARLRVPATCSRSRSATRPVGPGISLSPPPAGSPSASPRWTTATTSRTPRASPPAMREVVTALHLRRGHQAPRRRARQGVALAGVPGPGRPLEFLDSRIKVGNALLGAPRGSSRLASRRAFKPIEGDDPKVAALAAGRTRRSPARISQARLVRRTSGAGQQRQTLRHRSAPWLVASPSLATSAGRSAPTSRNWRIDPSCGRDKKIAQRLVRGLRLAQARRRTGSDHHRAATQPGARQFPLIRGRRGTRPPDQRYQFFHWHLEFPDVFRVVDDDAPDHNGETGWQGGFTCIVGNPPWERVKLQEQEFFATRAASIANARTPPPGRSRSTGSGQQPRARRPERSTRTSRTNSAPPRAGATCSAIPDASR